MFLVKVSSLLHGILCQSIFCVRVSSRGNYRAKFWHIKIKTRAAKLRGLYCKVKLTDYSTLSGIPSTGASPVGAASPAGAAGICGWNGIASSTCSLINVSSITTSASVETRFIPITRTNKPMTKAQVALSKKSVVF